MLRLSTESQLSRIFVIFSTISTINAILREQKAMYVVRESPQQRLTGADTSAVMILMLYMFAIIIAMLPGIIPALIVGFLIGGSSGTVFGLLIVTLWEIIAAAVCFYLSKGILHNCDMPAYRMVK